MIIENGYLVNKYRKGKDWFLVKRKSAECGLVVVSQIHVPGKYVGKRVRFKIDIEVV